MLFAAYAFYWHRKLPDWRGNARYLKQPDRGLWAFWQFLGSSAWTDEGRQLRNRHLFHWAMALLAGSIGHLVVWFL